MSKFWGFVAVILLVGFLFLAAGDGDGDIRFTDLETECRYADTPTTEMDFRKDNTLRFQGNFPFDNVGADTSYEYDVTADRVRLNILAENGEPPESFEETCLGQVVYKAETDPLPDGRYLVQLFHNGEKMEEMIVRTR